MKFLLCLGALCLSLHSVIACLNESEKVVARSDNSMNAAIPLKKALAIDPLQRGQLVEKKLRSSPEILRQIDHAVALIYQGKLQNAIGILEAIEKEKPGTYLVAANLGTAYELFGDNQKALHWIKEGVRRYPASHLGTEWLHVKILESKIAHAKDPAHFAKHSVLNLDLKSDGKSKNVLVGGESMPVEKVKTALQVQLSERLQFVKKPDPSVASLLFDYAAIEASENHLESARDLMQMALNFGYPSAKGHHTLKEYNRRIALATTKSSTPLRSN